jgi:hypothetical protein
MDTNNPDALPQSITNTLRQALEGVESALQKVEAELGPRELHVALLREQRDDLLGAATRLRRTLEANLNNDASTPPESESPSPPLELPLSEPPASEASASLEPELTASEGEAELPPRPPTTVDAVMQVLTDLGGSASLGDIRREFRDRGWLDSAFKNPDAALYAATKRLAKTKRLVRLGGGRYRLVPEKSNGEAHDDPR